MPGMTSLAFGVLGGPILGHTIANASTTAALLKSSAVSWRPAPTLQRRGSCDAGGHIRIHDWSRTTTCGGKSKNTCGPNGVEHARLPGRKADSNTQLDQRKYFVWPARSVSTRRRRTRDL